MPAQFRQIAYSLGWCAKAVDSIADRIVFDRFKNDDFEIGEIYKLNNPDVLTDSAALSALISACSFIYIGWDDTGYPTMQVIDGYNATGEIDTTTNLLTEGYAVLKRDRYNMPEIEAYFRPHQTDYYSHGKLAESFTHDAPYPLLVPIINRPDAKRHFGHSRISRVCMDITQAVIRTFRRMEICAEFYSFPQKYFLGVDPDVELDPKAATVASLLLLGRDNLGNLPVAGQFTQQSVAPFLDQLKAYASIFAGETGLTLDDFGFSTDNPASYDAIRASHEQLRLATRKAQRTFGTGYLNAGYLAACIRDKYSYNRQAFANTIPEFAPIFEPDATALGAAGDAINKINQVVPGFMGAENIRRLTGLESDAE